MRCAYSVILISSVLLLSACGSARSFSEAVMPSLHETQSRQIVQVRADFDTNIHHESPYFIVCLGEQCPKISDKTPLNIQVPVNGRPINVLSSSTSTNNRQSVTAHSDSYAKKSVEMLEAYRVHFDYASAELNDNAKTLLTEFVNNYSEKNQSIIITGFTDNSSKPNGKIGNHWLALERALSVKKILIALGYPESKILLEAKFLCCYIDSNESEAGRRNNRRAEISLIHVINQ